MTGDPIRDYHTRDVDQYEAERKRPHCCKCGKAIWDDYYWDIFDAIYCEECAEDGFRKDSDNYEG